MPINSKRKGSQGERELSAKIRETFGVPARRGQQFSGGEGSPDVVHGLTGLHLECKRTEKLQLWSAVDQAIADAGDNVPAVCHRPNNRPWLFICRLDDLPKVAAIIGEHANDVPQELRPTEAATAQE
jgi:Holliday junction resolvase